MKWPEITNEFNNAIRELIEHTSYHGYPSHLGQGNDDGCIEF